MKKMTMIGNAHIDPVWLWQWQEGYQEIKATFQSALDRMDETEDFVFTCACAAYYRWVEENAPDMFQKIQERVAQGRWVIAGGMWIQPDMNTPSGESFVRQLLYSQRYFYEKFGKTATFGYNVDSFGHNGSMPQIYSLAGIEDYVWMRPGIHENPNIPEGAMIWEGVDNTRMHAYRIAEEYVGGNALPEKIEKLFAFSERIGQPVMCFYGVGNHGGGPTIENLRVIHEYQSECEKGSEVVLASPQDYFKQLREEKLSLPVWHGELQHHASGCYSTHSKSKFMHRMAENSLLRMEKLGVLSNRLTGHEMNPVFVRQAWDNLMFNEFHDLMGGCSIRAAMEDCVMQLNESVSIAQREENALLQKMSWQVDTSKGNPVLRSKEEDGWMWGIRGQGTPVVVFNPHSFETETAVQMHRPVRTVRDQDGADVPVQIVRASRTNGEDCWSSIFTAKVPALGYRLYWVFKEETAEAESSLIVSETVLENAQIKAEFDPVSGSLIHLIDKNTGFDALKAPASARFMDIEESDTWAHNIFKFDKEAGKFSDAQITVLERGPVRAVLEVKQRFGISVLVQRYVLYANADQLEIEVKLDLQEHYRMVKLCYPTNGRTDVSEISYGVIERSGNGDEEHCQRWVAAQGEEGGLAVLNNGKYSYSFAEGELRMTIANTSAYADHYGQSFRDHYMEWMDQGEQKFRLVLVPYAGAWQNADLNHRADVLNQPLPHVVETYHKGSLPGIFEGIAIDKKEIDLGALKRSEDGKGWILRLTETTGQEQQAEIAISLLERSLTANFRPFEIKTFYIPEDKALPVHEVKITELE